MAEKHLGKWTEVFWVHWYGVVLVVLELKSHCYKSYHMYFCKLLDCHPTTFNLNYLVAHWFVHLGREISSSFNCIKS